MGSIDDYLAKLDPLDAAVIDHAYRVAKEVVPEAEQGQGYGMPALTYHGKPLLSVMRAKKHFGMYPFSAKVIESSVYLLAGFDCGKGTIRFMPGHPLPDPTLAAIVERRRDEIDG
ncbi:protein of unknown function (DU1801) [Tessaracoccus bendigoensis DSM 12906]|uniref:YdhG-like domain-containing protein n=1 Tax=Tessaracoccus bendigoensis DSM 12906 TaxID=1123357 RepID=A0A1M6GNG4_9ACTN|nr:DUF1801 domain-containing protein [Tessaracoccus bendigoensis]SHJ11501.1 protein of unknown function (DU1801) [Tessaracoccus bendigoensis DSM 12906]